MARLGVPVGGRVRKSRAVEDQSAPIPREITSKLGGITFTHSLRPCLRNGASLGEEAVLADSGRAGEVVAEVGRVRSLAFSSILRAMLTLRLGCKIPAYIGYKLIFPAAC